jgi:hypothetical protein
MMRVKEEYLLGGFWMDCGLEQIHVMKLTPWPMQIIAPMRAVFLQFN